jgi:hypothetical protein
MGAFAGGSAFMGANLPEAFSLTAMFVSVSVIAGAGNK